MPRRKKKESSEEPGGHSQLTLQVVDHVRGLIASGALHPGDRLPPERELARVILDRIAAQARAGAFREVRSRFPACNEALLATAKARFGVQTPFGGPTSTGMLTLHCPPDQVYALTSFLREQGAQAVAVADLDYVFARDNPLYARFEAGLGG